MVILFSFLHSVFVILRGMKKLLFVVGCVVCFCSCSKQGDDRTDHSCVCSNGESYVIKDATQSEAMGWCDSYDIICPPGVQCVTSWDCSLN